MIISEEGRLAYYQEVADSKFWGRHWRKSIDSAEWKKAEQGFLGWFEKAFSKYLPKKGKIIEAGCGLGYYVLALKRRGYEIEGVEWSRKAVGLIKQRYPKLKVRVGDVRKLPVKDGYYSGYISLGVVEHFKSGPNDYLREANRVLKKKGMAFISVPYFNLLRRIKNLLGFYRGSTAGLDFYQYAFTEAEIDRLIEQADFKVIDHFHYDAYKGIKEELPFLRNLLSLLSLSCEAGSRSARREHFLAAWQSKLKSDSHVPILSGLGMTFERPWWLKLTDRYFGHMTMVVCVKR